MKNAVSAARDLLGEVPRVTIESVECEPNLDYRCDAEIGFTHKSKALALVVEAKANGAPRFVRTAVLQLESSIDGWDTHRMGVYTRVNQRVEID